MAANKTYIIIAALLAAVLLYFFIIRRYVAVFNAANEKRYWKGRKETNPSTHQRLQRYWNKGAGWHNVNSSNISNVAISQAWSAAGLAYVMRKTHPNFPKTSSHWQYVKWAIDRRRKGKRIGAAYFPHEKRPRPGDIIVAGREGHNPTLSNFTPGPSHGDIVVSNTGRTVNAIGFNLSDTVKKVSFPARNGYLQSNHFAVIRM